MDQEGGSLHRLQEPNQMHRTTGSEARKIYKDFVSLLRRLLRCRHWCILTAFPYRLSVLVTESNHSHSMGLSQVFVGLPLFSSATVKL
jgi:hypothetical protein